MLPFGQAVLLWRVERGFSQQQLAERARLSRPNLSAVERGKRDVNLTTLRALAVALDVTPGTLVDGIAPHASSGDVLFTRDALERIVSAAISKKSLADKTENHLAQLLRESVRWQLKTNGRWAGDIRRGKRTAERAWLGLKAVAPRDVVNNLMTRVTKHLSIDE
jgi:transcriptional regulator with XRE-family HTH domain